MAAAANCGGVTRPSSGLQISSRQSFLSLQMRRLQRHAQPPRQVDGPNLQVAGVMIDSAPELMSTSRRRRRRRRGSLSDEEVKMAKRNERPRTRGSQVEHNEDLCNESTNTHSNSIKKTRHSINICRPLNESPPLQLPPHLQKSPRRHPLPLPLLTLLLGFCCLGPSIALADHDGDSQDLGPNSRIMEFHTSSVNYNSNNDNNLAASSLLLLASKSRNLVLDPPQVLDGSAATTATVAATAPSTTTQPPPVPDFEAPIGNQTVAVGRDAQLSCRIKDLGNFKTAWLRVEDKGILTIHNNVITRNYRFGLNSDDGKEFVLTIKNVQPSDKGGYMCQINSVPMKFAVGYLDVLTPPAFAEQVDPAQALSRQDSAGAQDQASAIASAQGLIVVTEGTNTTLTCKAGGHPTPEITWRREDGQAILVDGPNSEGVAKVDGPNLTLGPVHRLQAGAYLCIASNGVQPSASRRQVLDVQFSPIIRLPETEVGAPLNEPELTLNCYIELNPLGSYHWVRMPSTRIGGSTMSISSGGGSSSGNSGGSRLLSMQEGVAQGSTSTEVIAAALSDDASLIEHDELTNSDKFEIVIKQMAPDKMHMALTVRKLERADFAWYKCIVKNSLGIQSSAIKVYETQAAAAAPQPSSTGGFFGSLGGTSRQSADTQLNDQASKPAKQHGPILNPRAHTRSSWIQRSASGGSGGSRGGSMADDSASSSASQAIASPVMSHANSHLLIMLSLLLLSITILSLFPPQ